MAKSRPKREVLDIGYVLVRHPVTARQCVGRGGVLFPEYDVRIGNAFHSDHANRDEAIAAAHALIELSRDVGYIISDGSQ